MKKIILLGTLVIMVISCQAQFLKKIKDKVNKTIGKDDGAASAEKESSTAGKVSWCDTLTTQGGDGISYTKAYSGSGNMSIVYTESSLGLKNDPAGYRLILSQYVGGKTMFTVVENGQVVDTDTKVKTSYLTQNAYSGGQDGSGGNDDLMKKYIIADSTRNVIPKTSAKSVKVEKVDDSQMDMILNIMRQTDDYKNASPSAQKEMENDVTKGISPNNSMAGKTFSAPASAGGSFSTVNGYKLIVKGKNYGKFMLPPAVSVSQDELAVYAVGLDEKGMPVMVTQVKRTPLDKTKFSGNGGKMLRSPDSKRAVYIEQRAMTAAELQKVSAGGAHVGTFTVLRSDGSTLQLADYSSNGKFSLTNTGAMVNVNGTTGELYLDNKKIGQFKLPAGETVEPEAVLIGSGPSNIAYYDGSSGSLNYLDGSVKKLGIMYPSVVVQNGKTFMSWFRKCKNDIYIGKWSY